MRRTRRKLMLATVASVLGATAAIPMIMSGTANAQAGSRICGREWTPDPNSKFREKVIRIYEVPKEGSTECNWAKSSGNDSENPLSAPFDLNEKIGSWWTTRGISQMTCEDFTRSIVGNPARTIEFVGDNWPMPHDQVDICKNMNRSDDIFSMHKYWLYLPDYASNFAEMPWQFKWNGTLPPADPEQPVSPF